MWNGPSSAAYNLRKLKLTRLNLNIAPPSPVTASDWLDGACQKTVVDWILAAAWPFVRGHPITVKGFIKTNQKVEFELAAEEQQEIYEVWSKLKMAADGDEGTLANYDECCGDDDEEGGLVVVDRPSVKIFEPAEAIITERKPLCLCRVPCTTETWDPDA